MIAERKGRVAQSYKQRKKDNPSYSLKASLAKLIILLHYRLRRGQFKHVNQFRLKEIHPGTNVFRSFLVLHCNSNDDDNMKANSTVLSPCTRHCVSVRC